MTVAEGAPTTPPIVAILGAGQLGRMLALAGEPLGVRCRFLDPSPDATAGAFGPLTVGALDDRACIDTVSKGATVVTYEWEGVPADGARAALVNAPVRPDPRALEIAQDRLIEKETFRRVGIGVPAYSAVGEDALGLDEAISRVGLPAILKTRRGGYDGKGQHVLRTDADVDAARRELEAPMILEAFVPFDRELSVLAVRALDGDTRFWPLVENVHEGGILRVSRAPAPGLTPELRARGEAAATLLLDELGYVGVLAVELFERDGQLLANEFAPRVHNSGHWTIEGAETSQFENHLRAVLGWPLGSTATRGFAGMVNCIGALPDRAAVHVVPGAYFHDYDKAPRPGRKVGHVTVVAASAEERDERLAQIGVILDVRI